MKREVFTSKSVMSKWNLYPILSPKNLEFGSEMVYSGVAEKGRYFVFPKFRQIRTFPDTKKKEAFPLLMGVYQNSIDAKNRVIVPSKFRDELGYKAVLSRGLDNCLIIYPMETWEEQQKQLASLPKSDPQARAFLRYIYSNAVECEIDKQGRTVIPLNLREAAGIEKELVTIGMMDRVEIWAKEVYESDDQGGKLDAESFKSFSTRYQV